MRKYWLIILLVNVLSVAAGQGIKSTWFFDEDRFFKLEDEKVNCEPFDFINKYEIHGDSLTFRHFYKAETKECYTYNDKGERIQIKCADESIPDSKFLISKLTLDSLFLVPVNNSAKAISAKLKRMHYGSIEEIAKNPEAKDISYFEVVKLYNTITLYENIEWDTLTLSHTTMGWWGIYYFDIKILNNGHFFAIDRYRPFETNKKENAKAIFYEDNLPTSFVKEISNELNNSGLKRIDKIDFTGWSSHGRKITLKVVVSKDTKLFTAYEYCFPYTLKSLVRKISDLERDQNFKTTDNQFVIETSFLNAK